MTIDGRLRTGVNDTELTRRALQVVRDKTTDMADDVLKVPLHYYRDPKITEIEESQILRRTPLAVLPSAQVAAPNDYVVRSVLGDSLLVTRDKDGRSHVFLNYCRHRGRCPPAGQAVQPVSRVRTTHGRTKTTESCSPSPAMPVSPGWTGPTTDWSSCPIGSATASFGRC